MGRHCRNFGSSLRNWFTAIPQIHWITRKVEKLLILLELWVCRLKIWDIDRVIASVMETCGLCKNDHSSDEEELFPLSLHCLPIPAEGFPNRVKSSHHVLCLILLMHANFQWSRDSLKRQNTDLRFRHHRLVEIEPLAPTSVKTKRKAVLVKGTKFSGLSMHLV